MLCGKWHSEHAFGWWNQHVDWRAQVFLFKPSRLLYFQFTTPNKYVETESHELDHGQIRIMWHIYKIKIYSNKFSCRQSQLWPLERLWGFISCWTNTELPCSILNPHVFFNTPSSPIHLWPCTHFGSVWVCESDNQSWKIWVGTVYKRGCLNPACFAFLQCSYCVKLGTVIWLGVSWLTGPLYTLQYIL